MESEIHKTVTVIYYSESSLELLHEIRDFYKAQNGRVVIPESFKRGKSIVAVCDGEVNILNKIGDRILSMDDIA
jgi:uncharacterized protein (TIGR02922 family)